LLQVHGGRDFVKNGDTWTVAGIHPDGSIDVLHRQHAGAIRLPAAYVAREVELGYAVTAHRAQGMTVDTAHAPLVGNDTSREALYVAASRGRQGSQLYVLKDNLLAPDLDPPEQRQRNAREVLADVISRSEATPSATETIRGTACRPPNHPDERPQRAVATSGGMARFPVGV
jgi:ATP-dependent exoDNAse (exonuclease V) alpha subunit